jgi:hypothetical protein
LHALGGILLAVFGYWYLVIGIWYFVRMVSMGDSLITASR